MAHMDGSHPQQKCSPVWQCYPQQNAPSPDSHDHKIQVVSIFHAARDIAIELKWIEVNLQKKAAICRLPLQCRPIWCWKAQTFKNGQPHEVKTWHQHAAQCVASGSINVYKRLLKRVLQSSIHGIHTLLYHVHHIMWYWLYRLLQWLDLWYTDLTWRIGTHNPTIIPAHEATGGFLCAGAWCTVKTERTAP